MSQPEPHWEFAYNSKVARASQFAQHRDLHERLSRLKCLRQQRLQRGPHCPPPQ